MSFEERQRPVFAAIAKIFVDCVKPTVPWMKDFLTQLCDEDGITEDEQSRLQEQLTDVGIQDVMKQTLELAKNKDDGLEIFKSVLIIDEDLALEVSDEAKKISELLLGNWKDEESANLIRLWDELTQNKDYATSIATKIWTESHAICDGNWPQDFVCFCLATSERTKIAEFVTSFSLGQATTFTHEEETVIVIKDCLLQIFTQCLDSKMMTKLIVKLRGKRALTKEQKKSLFDQVKNNSTQVTAREMIDVVGDTERGLQYFADVFQEGEIPFAEKVKDMVIATVQHDLKLQQMKLISLWAELFDNSEISKRRIEELWQDVPRIVDDDWPLNFIHFCITSQGDDVEKVEMLVNDIADVTMRFQTASEPSQNEEAFSISDFMGEDDVSFVIVNEEECSDDNMQITKQPDDAEHEPYIPPNTNENVDESRIASSKGMHTDQDKKEIDYAMSQNGGEQQQVEDKESQGAGGDIVTINNPADEDLEENRSWNSSTFTSGSNNHLGMTPAADQGKETVDQANDDISGMYQTTTTSTPGSEGQEKMIVQATLHGVKTDDGNDGETVTTRKPADEELEVYRSWHSSEYTHGPCSHSDTKPAADKEERLVDQANADPSGTDQTTTASTPSSEGQEELINQSTSHGGKAHEENGSSPIDELNSTGESSAYIEQEIEGTAEQHVELENGDGAGNPTSEESTDEESTDEESDNCSWHSTDDLNSHSDSKPVTDTGLSDGSRHRDIVLLQPESPMHDLIAHRQQIDEVLTQSEASDNTNMDGQPMTVEFRVIVKEQNWISEGWQPQLLLDGICKQMEYSKSEGYYYYQIHVHGDQQEFYYSYRLQKTERTRNRYRSEFLPGKSPVRDTFVIKGVNQTMLDIATFNNNESISGWITLMEKWFYRFLPNMCNHKKPTKLIRNEIQAWFDVAYLGWQFNTPEDKPHLEKLPTEKIEKITETWLRSLMKSENKTMVVACSIFVIVFMDERRRPVRDQDLLKTLLLGLQIQEIDGPMQKTLHKELIFLLEQRKLTDGLERFLSACANSAYVSLILALPLYQLIFWNGDVYAKRFKIYGSDLLKERALLNGKIDWDGFHRSVQEKKKHTELLSLSGSILKLSDTHPYIVDTYHYFLPLGVMIKLIKMKEEVATKFQIDSIFSQILPFFKTDNKKNLTSIISKLSVNLIERFKDHSEAVDIAADHQRAASEQKVKHLLESIVAEIKWYGNNVKDFNQFKQKCSNWLMSMATHCFSWFHALNSDPSYLDESHGDIVQSARKIVLNDYKHSKEIDDKKLEFYNTLIGLNWYYDRFQSEWRDKISFEVGKCIEKRWEGADDEHFLGFYTKIAPKKFQNALNAVLENKFTDCLSRILQSMGDKAGSKVPTCLGNFFTKGIFNPFATAFEKTWEKYYDEDPTMQSLKFLADSEMALLLYKAFGHENLSILIESAASRKLRRLHEETHSICEKMQQKKITLKQMNFIIGNKGRIAELLFSIENQKRAGDSGRAPLHLEIKLLMETNEKIVMSYCERCAAIYSFIEFCSSLRTHRINVDCKNLTGLIREDASLEEAERCNLEDTHLNEMKLILLIQNCKMLARARQKVATNYYNGAQETSPTKK